MQLIFHIKGPHPFISRAPDTPMAALRFRGLAARRMDLIHGHDSKKRSSEMCRSQMTKSLHGSLNVPIEHHPTIRYMVYNGYYKVMSNIPKMGHLPTPALRLINYTTGYYWIQLVDPM